MSESSHQVSLLERAKALPDEWRLRVQIWRGYDHATVYARCIVEAEPIIRDLVAEVERLTGQGWQSIATAPKDGTPVLVCRASWVAPSIMCYLDGPRVVEGWHPYEVSPAGRKPHRPDFWMPLPAPPEDR